MTPEEAIQVADEALLDHTGSRLTHIQRMILCESLAGKGYEQMVGYDAQHIKNEGSDLWQLLSQALGEKVSKKNFKGALEKRLKLGDIVPKPPMPSSYNQQTWVGRESLISDLLPKLLPKLQGQTRLLWITGISGIGKTTLGECLVSQAWESDPTFQWIYLEVLEGQSPDFPSVAADLLAKLGDRDLDPQERNNPDQLARRLLQKLQSHPYWIQLDALERLLKPEHSTEFVDPYWATFLQLCLTEPVFPSRLVLTSQAFPNVLVEWNDRYSNVWAEIRLEGLLQVEQQLEFFAKRGIAVDAANQDILARIAKIYEGHPLALKVIAEEILKEFAGDVVRYWQVYQPEFEQVSRELQAARLDETDYNEALDRKVRDRIKKSLQQLPTDALDLLCRSAVFRRPVPKKFWLAMIDDYSPKRQKAAYRTLDDRALVEKEGTDIRQHNLIRDIAYNLLRQDSVVWETAERQAADQWLTAHQPAPDAPNLEKIRSYLEAFHHYCAIEQWQEAYVLATTRLDTPTQEQLHNQLNTWSYYHEQILLYEEIFGKFDESSNATVLHNLGNAYLSSGYFEKAVPFYKERLRIAQLEGDLDVAISTLSNLGLVFNHLKKYKEAFEYLEQGLKTAESISSFKGKAACLRNLGLVYKNTHKYDLAKRVLNESLAMLSETCRFREECAVLATLGQIYLNLSDYKLAAEKYQTGLSIAKKIGDRQQEMMILKNLGDLYSGLEQYAEAIDNYENSLQLSRTLGEQKLEGDISSCIGICYGKIEELDKSFEWHKQHLKIAEEVCDYSGQVSALINLGCASYLAKKDVDALHFLKKALEVHGSRDEYNKKIKVNLMWNFSLIALRLTDMKLAREYCDRALALAIELGIPLAEECRSLQADLNQEMNHDQSGND